MSKKKRCACCGSEMEEDALTCWFCGRSANDDVSSLLRQKSATRKTKRLFRYVAVILVVVCAGGYYYYQNTHTPEALRDNAIEDIVSKFNSSEGFVKDSLAYNILRLDSEWEYDDVEDYIICLLLRHKEELREDAFKHIEDRAFEGVGLCQRYLGAIYFFAPIELPYNGNPKKDEICFDIRKRNFEKSMYWYKQAIENGELDPSLNNLGMSYEYGIGVPQDMRKAVECFKRGTELGFAGCQYNYGCMYENGVYEGEDTMHVVIVPRDIKKAIYWWKKAAAKGDELAKDKLQKVYE